MVRNKNKLGQYFTPQAICDFMVGLSEQTNQIRVLEPSSGDGAFLDALDRAGYINVTGVEVDSEIATHSKFPVINDSFISWQNDKKFDLVIGNPPYIRWKDLADAQREEILAHRYFGTLINSLSDYLLPFIALSVEHLRDQGELIFITPGFWLQTKHSKPLRDFLESNGAITDVVDFGETALFKGVATSLIVFKFVKTRKTRKTNLHRFIGEKSDLTNLSLTNANQFRSEEVSNFKVKDKFVLTFDDEVALPIALEQACAPNSQISIPGEYQTLGSYVRIANGMVTGLDTAFKLPADLIQTIPEAELCGISRVVKGRNLENLVSRDWSNYIDIDPKLSHREVIEQFPILMQHLEGFRPELQKRYNYGNGSQWWHWSFYRSSDFLRSKSKKGYVPGKERLTHKSRVRFALSVPGAIATQDVSAFAPKAETKESIEYIVAFLNREVVSKWIRAFGLMKGGVAEFSEKPLSEIPFRAINWDDSEEVSAHEQITRVIRALENSNIEIEVAERELSTLFAKLMPQELSV